jgi:hypothetical protein
MEGIARDGEVSLRTCPEHVLDLLRVTAVDKEMRAFLIRNLAESTG